MIADSVAAGALAGFIALAIVKVGLLAALYAILLKRVRLRAA